MQTPAKYLSKITPKNPSLPILQYVQAKDGFLTATNLEIGLRLKTELPNGIYKIIGTDFILDKNLPIDKFPTFPEITENHVFSATTENLITALKPAPNFIYDDDRPEIHGVSIKTENGDVKIASTDTYTLYVATMRAKVLQDVSFILPKPKLIAGIIESIGDLAHVYYDMHETENGKRESVKFKGNDGEIITRTIIGEYPNYPLIYPEFTVQLQCDRKEILKSLKELLPYAKECELPHVIVETKVDWSEMRFTRKEETKNIDKSTAYAKTEYSTVKTKPEIAHDGVIVMPIRKEKNQIKEKDQITVIFNINYLIRALNALTEDTLYIYQTDNPSASPMLFTNQIIN